MPAELWQCWQSGGTGELCRCRRTCADGLQCPTNAWGQQGTQPTSGGEGIPASTSASGSRSALPCTTEQTHTWRGCCSSGHTSAAPWCWWRDPGRARGQRNSTFLCGHEIAPTKWGCQLSLLFQWWLWEAWTYSVRLECSAWGCCESPLSRKC